MQKALVVLSLVLILSGCTSYRFTGTIEKVTGPMAQKECGYCLRDWDGKGGCGGIETSKVGDLEGYAGKRVVVYGQEHEGVVTLMCPYAIDAERIELVE